MKPEEYFKDVKIAPVKHAKGYLYGSRNYTTSGPKRCQWRLYGKQENCSNTIIYEGGIYCPKHYKAIKNDKQITSTCQSCGVGTFKSPTQCSKCLRKIAEEEEWLIQF